MQRRERAEEHLRHADAACAISGSSIGLRFGSSSSKSFAGRKESNRLRVWSDGILGFRLAGERVLLPVLASRADACDDLL